MNSHDISPRKDFTQVFPPELAKLVFRFLDDADKVAVCYVSRAWHAYFKDELALQGPVFLGRRDLAVSRLAGYFDRRERILNEAGKFHPNLSVLNVPCRPEDGPECLRLISDRDILPQELRIRLISEHELREVVGKDLRLIRLFEELDSLTVYMRTVSDCGDFVGAISLMTNLRKLEMKFGCISVAPRKRDDGFIVFQRLQEFTVSFGMEESYLGLNPPNEFETESCCLHWFVKHVKFPELRKLELNRCPISGKDLRRLVGAKLKELVVFNLSFSGIFQLLRAFEGSEITLSKLLFYNEVGMSISQRMDRMDENMDLSILSQVQDLEVEDANLSMDQFLKVIEKTNGSITNLHIMTHIDVGSISSLEDSNPFDRLLQHCPNLQKLTLMVLYDALCILLAQALRRWRKQGPLLRLDLSFNPLTKVGIESLMKAPKFKELYIGGCDVPDEYVEDVNGCGDDCRVIKLDLS